MKWSMKKTHIIMATLLIVFAVGCGSFVLPQAEGNHTLSVPGDPNSPPLPVPSLVDVGLEIGDGVNEATKFFNPWYAYTSMGIGLLASLRQMQKRGKALKVTTNKYMAAKIGQNALEVQVKAGKVGSVEDVPDVLFAAIGSARQELGV